MLEDGIEPLRLDAEQEEDGDDEVCCCQNNACSALTPNSTRTMSALQPKHSDHLPCPCCRPPSPVLRFRPSWAKPVFGARPMPLMVGLQNWQDWRVHVLV